MLFRSDVGDERGGAFDSCSDEGVVGDRTEVESHEVRLKCSYAIGCTCSSISSVPSAIKIRAFFDILDWW